MNNDSHSLFRPTYATVDLQAVRHNFKILKSLVPEKVGFLAIVKADAYGHGAIPVSLTLLECGVQALGVATVEEGIELRQAGLATPILVMGGLMGMGGPAAEAMAVKNLTPVIHSAGVIDNLEAVAQKYNKNLDVHLKVDTGMSRLGVRPENLPSLLKKLVDSPRLKVRGVMTHLAKAEDIKYTNFQMQSFTEAKNLIEQRLGAVEIYHIANSAAVISRQALTQLKAQKVWVRPGIGLYGFGDGVKVPKDIDLKPVMALQSRIALLKHVPQDTAVSYGCTYVTKRPTHLGVVPIGYADGYRFNFTDQAYVLVRGQKAPVVGRVTMDMIMIDVTDIKDVAIGDEVVLLGSQGQENITAEEMAGWANTITYEVFCGISKRIPRIYK